MEYRGYKGIKPRNETVKKWLLTRKRAESEYMRIGDFCFSGIYTVQDYKRDKIFFVLALLGEVAFLVIVSLLLGGFDMLMSLIAIALVILDFIGAYLYHRNEDEICKAQLELNADRYKETSIGIHTDDVRKSTERLQMLKNNSSRKIGMFLIICSAVLKVTGSVFLFEIPALTVVLTVIYCFVAFVHIKKTGFWYAGYQFYRAMDKEHAYYVMGPSDNHIKNLDKEDDFKLLKVENIPAGVVLKPIRRYVFENTNIYDSLVLVENKNGDDGQSAAGKVKEWHYRIWQHHFWDDSDLLQFIDSKAGNEVLDDTAKAFIAADYSKRRFLNYI